MKNPTARLESSLPIEDYHNNREYISKSMLAEIACPKRYKWLYIDGNAEKATASMNLGNAVHTYALEPELFKKRFHVLPATYTDKKTGEEKPFRKDPRMAVYKTELAVAGDRIVLDAADEVKLKGMAKALTEDPLAMSLLSAPGHIEASIFWEDESGLKLKERADFKRDDGLIVDLKTTTSSAPKDFQRIAIDKHYDVSCALSCRGYEALYGKMPDNYVFLVIEQEPPHIITAFDCFRPFTDEEADAPMSYYDIGKYRLDTYLARLKSCMESGVWPGYHNEITPMAAPVWAVREIEKGV